MMRIITIFFIAISLYCCQNAASRREIIKKAKKVRAELLTCKSLPSNFLKQRDGSNASSDRGFIYYAIRKENNSVDSILMIVSIYLEDSLEHILSFNEVHLKDNKTYMYKINKQGIIDWAYKADDPENLHTQDIEINTDSTNYIPKFLPLKKPDEKTMAFYTAKLTTSLDELDKMLSVK